MEEPNHGIRKTNEVEEIWSNGAKRRRRGSEEPCSHHNEEGDEDASGTSNGHSSKGAAAWPTSIHPGTTDHR